MNEQVIELFFVRTSIQYNSCLIAIWLGKVWYHIERDDHLCFHHFESEMSYYMDRSFIGAYSACKTGLLYMI